ncbi:MAG: immunoglobulin domain-containing protein, partial [Limisphaerales bacterium]
PFTVVTGNPTTSPPGLPAVLTGLHSFSLGWGNPYCFCGFTVQPQSQTVVVGSAATFTVAVNAYPAAAYQWYFNGHAIDGAIYGDYTIPSVQSSDAGPYSVMAYNPMWGAHWSDTATLTVSPPPPVITAQPLSRTAEVGSAPFFSVTFTGSPPASCQWFFNQDAITGSTNAGLWLSAVQPAQAGLYTVVVSNTGGGSVTSAPAALSVIRPVQRRLVPTLELTGQAGTLMNLNYASTLSTPVNWQLLSTVALTKAPQFYCDFSSPLSLSRFYRAWQTGGPPVLPALKLYMVPGIALTGSLGSSVLLEGINMVGPTGAWFPVATVVLTNVSELYPDVSSIGQPPRLWRVQPIP